MPRFFSYSFTASDGSEESTAGRVVSPCSIMMHHGFRSIEARRARKQKYRLRQTTSHSSMFVARQGDISRKINQAFLLVDSFNFNFVDEECSDICINNVSKILSMGTQKLSESITPSNGIIVVHVVYLRVRLTHD